MTKHRGLILTLLQISLVASFPHRGRHHKGPKDYLFDVDYAAVPYSSLGVSAPIYTSAPVATPSFSADAYPSSPASEAPQISSVPVQVSTAPVPATTPSTSSLVSPIVSSQPATSETYSAPSQPLPSPLPTESPVDTLTSPAQSALPSTSVLPTSSESPLPPPQASSHTDVEPQATPVTSPPVIVTSTPVFTSTTSSETESTSVPAITPPTPQVESKTISASIVPPIPSVATTSLTTSTSLSSEVSSSSTSYLSSSTSSYLSSSSSSYLSSSSSSYTPSPHTRSHSTSSTTSYSSSTTSYTSSTTSYSSSSSSPLDTTSAMTRSKSGTSSSTSVSLTSSSDTFSTTSTATASHASSKHRDTTSNTFDTTSTATASHSSSKHHSSSNTFDTTSTATASHSSSKHKDKTSNSFDTTSTATVRHSSSKHKDSTSNTFHTTSTAAVSHSSSSHDFETTSTASPEPAHSHKKHIGNPWISQGYSSPISTVVSLITTTQEITRTRTASNPTPPALSPQHSQTKKSRKHRKFKTVTTTQFTSLPEVTLETTLTISEIQTLTYTETVTPPTSGVVHTSLNTVGQNTQQPFQTTIVATPGKPLKPIMSGTNKIKTTVTATPEVPPTGASIDNIFVPVATGAPPPQIPSNPDHPVPRIGIKKTGPIETNKFYANFFLGDRTAPTFTHPYSVAWVEGQGVSQSWGISVQQVPKSEVVYGPGTPPQYFINPIGLQEMILSARELGATTNLSMDGLTGFSCNVLLAPATGAAPVIVFPLVQGMGFVTAAYKAGTPMIQSSIFFSSLMYLGTTDGGAARYSATLYSGATWLIYVTAKSGSSAPTLTLVNSGQILGNMAFTGTVQVAKVPINSTLDAVQAIYDASAGVYPIGTDIQGSVDQAQGSYTLTWRKKGLTSKPLLMFALPHHVDSFSASTAADLQPSLVLDTTTKGVATAVRADSWTLVHNDLPYDMGFAPWRPQTGTNSHLSESAQELIRTVAASELAENFTEQTDLDSMYYSGKGLAKFAFTVYATNNLAHDVGTASAGLKKLKASFARFVNNTQIYPLYYDSAWGGAVSSCSYLTGSDSCDFGNTYYNDHHFHYGYFVYTAAVIGYLDPAWLKQGTNMAWVNMLVRDYANPVSDGYFPFQRMFDWYHGHSWAHGLYETFDGKDQESSSEDTFSLYALKMWGKVIGDANMEARGNLLLAVQAASLQHYYLLTDNNKVEPPVYIPNKAAGIIFENKIDHTTYFGTNIEYIEGIHMLPLAPQSTLSRTKAFVSQEWNTYFSDGRTDSIDSGWLGILYANYAIVNPVAAYQFFAQPDFSPAWLDGGASRTWYLAWCAGLGGAPS